MNLLAHITTPDSVVLATMFCLGLTTGVILTSVAARVWARRKR